MNRNKKGVTPVVATVLLVAMTIVIGLVVFLWFKNFSGEVVTKFDGKNVQIVCNDVEFDAEYVDDYLRISNTGNVPIFEFKVKIEGNGFKLTKKIDELDNNWPSTGLNQGGSYSSSDLSTDPDIASAEKIILIPALLGTSKSGERIHTCDEGQNGYEIPVA